MKCNLCGADEDIYALPNQNYPGWFKHFCSATGREVHRRASGDGADASAMESSRSQSRANADFYREHGHYPDGEVE